MTSLGWAGVCFIGPVKSTKASSRNLKTFKVILTSKQTFNDLLRQYLLPSHISGGFAPAIALELRS